MDYLRQLRTERPLLFWVITAVVFWLAFQLALYESTKRTLLSTQWDDMNDYADAKTDVILAIKARATAARDVRR